MRSTCNNFSVALYVAYKVREVIVMFKRNKGSILMIAHIWEIMEVLRVY